MKCKNLGAAGVIAAICGGCAVGAEDGAGFEFSPEAEAGFFTDEELGSKEQAYGEITCPTATQNVTIMAAPDRTIPISVAQQDNAQCRWTRVVAVDNVKAGTFFFNTYDDVVPVNKFNCESIFVRMDVYKFVGGAWVLDVKRTASGVWDSWSHPNACAVPSVNRSVPTDGTYKLILNGRYAALTYEHRSKIKLRTWLTD